MNKLEQVVLSQGSNLYIAFGGFLHPGSIHRFFHVLLPGESVHDFIRLPEGPLPKRKLKDNWVEVYLFMKCSVFTNKDNWFWRVG